MTGHHPVAVDSLVHDLAERGYCLIEDVIPANALEATRESVRADILANTRTPPPAAGVSNIFRFNQSLLRYLSEPRVQAVVHAALGGDFRVSFATGYVTGSGRDRDIWHADWPYNQRNATHIDPPFPDVVLHLTTFWLLTDFRADNGATYIVPGSHKRPDHPRPGNDLGDWMAPQPGESRLLGKAGSVAICDSRIWHAVAPNTSDEDRVAVVVRFAPWWLNLNPVRRGTSERARLVDARQGRDSVVEHLPASVFENVPDEAKPLLYHLLPPDAPAT